METDRSIGPRIFLEIGDNVAMEETAEQYAATVLEAIRMGRDLWLYDQPIGGADPLECARKVLIERRDASSDPDEAAFLTSVIRCLENSDDPSVPRGV